MMTNGRPQKTFFQKFNGAITLLDSLGTKGIWKVRDPNDVLMYWDAFVGAYMPELVKIEDLFNVKCNIHAFSDTIILTVKGSDPEYLIGAAGGLTSAMVTAGLALGIYLRGCISVGDIYESDKMVLGPAIDEAAQHYNNSNWIGAFTSPSSDTALIQLMDNKRSKVRLHDIFIKYDIPAKNGKIKSWAVVLDDDFGSPIFRMLAHHNSVIAFINEKLQNAKDLNVSEKWKNTLTFMYYLKTTGK